MGSSTKYPPWNVGILCSLMFIGLFCSLILCSEALLNSYLKADMKVQIVPLSQTLKGGSPAGEGFQRKINSHHYLSRTSYGKNHHVSPAEYKAHLKSLAQGLGIRVHVYGGKKPHPNSGKEWTLKNSLEHSPKLQDIEDEIIKSYKKNKKKKGSIKIVRGNNGHDDTTEEHDQDDKRYTTSKFTKYSSDSEGDDDHRPKPKDGYRQEGFRKDYEDGHDDEPDFRRESYGSSSPQSSNNNKRPRFKEIELSPIKDKRESDEGPDCVEFERGLLHCKPGNSKNYKNDLDSFEVYVRKYKERDRNRYKDRSELKETKSQFKKGSSSKSPYEDYEGPYKGDPELGYPSVPSGDGRDVSGYRYSYGKESPPEYVTKDFRYFSESPKVSEGFSRYPEKSPGEFYGKEGPRYLPPKEYPPPGSIGLPMFNPQREFSPDSKIPAGYKLAEYPMGISGPYQHYPSSGSRDYPRPPPPPPLLPHEINDSPPKSPGNIEGLKYPLDPYPIPAYYGNPQSNPYSTTDTPTINYNSRPIDHPEHEKGPYPLQTPYPSQQPPLRAYQPTEDSPATGYPSSSPQEVPQYPNPHPKSPYPQHNLDDNNPHVGQSGSSQKVTVTGPSEKGFDIVYHHNYNMPPPPPPRPISAPPTLSSSIPTTPQPEIATNTSRSQFASLYPRKARFTNPLENQWVGIHSSDALMDMRASVPLIPPQGITTEGSEIITAPSQMQIDVSSTTAPTTTGEIPTQIERTGKSSSSSNDTMSSSSSNVVNVIYIGKNETSASTSVSKDLIIGKFGLVEDVELPSQTATNANNESHVNLNMRKVGLVEDVDLELPSRKETNATSESHGNRNVRKAGVVEDVDLDPVDVKEELPSQTTTISTSKPRLNLNMSSGKKFISLASSE